MCFVLFELHSRGKNPAAGRRRSKRWLLKKLDKKSKEKFFKLPKGLAVCVKWAASPSALPCSCGWRSGSSAPTGCGTTINEPRPLGGSGRGCYCIKKTPGSSENCRGSLCVFTAFLPQFRWSRRRGRGRGCSARRACPSRGPR